MYSFFLNLLTTKSNKFFFRQLTDGQLCDNTFSVHLEWMMLVLLVRYTHKSLAYPFFFSFFPFVFLLCLFTCWKFTQSSNRWSFPFPFVYFLSKNKYPPIKKIAKITNEKLKNNNKIDRKYMRKRNISKVQIFARFAAANDAFSYIHCLNMDFILEYQF